VTRLAGVTSDYKDDNPTLTDDLCELFFTSERPGGLGGADVWRTRRETPEDDFETPTPVESVNTEGFDASPAISGDGLTLWVGRELADVGLGGLDIWQATRSSASTDFGEPSLVSELNSALDDIPRPLGDHGRSMPFGSRRESSIYATFLATRPAPDQPFASPRRLTEIEQSGYNASDAFLTQDGLSLYFARAIEERGDLFVATRPDTSSPFGSPLGLSSINQEDSDERDPWLSPDGTRLYFSSDRDGVLNIYEARRALE
jgi:hypothetical protein